MHSIMRADWYKKYLFVFPMDGAHGFYGLANASKVEFIQRLPIAQLFLPVKATRGQMHYDIIVEETVRRALDDIAPDWLIELDAGAYVHQEFFRYHAAGLTGLPGVVGVHAGARWLGEHSEFSEDAVYELPHFDPNGLSMGVDEFFAMMDFVSARRNEGGYRELCQRWVRENRYTIAYPDVSRVGYEGVQARWSAVTPRNDAWRVLANPGREFAA
jgi:hypothetical protein